MCIVIYFFWIASDPALLPAQSGPSAPLESPQGTLVVGPVAARGRHRAGHVAAGTSATDHHRNRRVMKYYITDNTAPAVHAVGNSRSVVRRILHADLPLPGRRALPYSPLFRPLPLGDRLRFFCLLLDDAEAKVLIASHAMEYYDEQELPRSRPCTRRCIRSSATSPNVTVCVSTACRGLSRCVFFRSTGSTAAVRWTTTPSTRWRALAA